MASIAGTRSVLKRELGTGPQLLWKYWSAQEVQGACRQCGHHWRERFWTPLETLWVFLLQVLNPGSSCRKAVAMALTQEAAEGQDVADSPDPSAYCQARHRLPLAVIRRGVSQIGQGLEEQVGSALTWLGRRVWVVDGSSCSMPDTPELQKAFGQPGGQAPGCGFPVAKIVTMFAWASGAVREVAIGPWRVSELHLWRKLWHLLRPGDLVLGDRFYCTYADIAGLLGQGCDAVFRLHQRRSADMRQGRRLGRQDRLVTWERPLYRNRPRGMNRAEWSALPLELTVRLIRFAVAPRGFRCRTILVATTLLDPRAYPAAKIAALYRDRWLAELRLRDLKITLGMDVLRGKTPDIVRKEIHMHLLAYNLIRALMWQAAKARGGSLHRLSFAGTVDRLDVALPFLVCLGPKPAAHNLYLFLLEWIAHDTLPDRPNRIEPRAVKRRPKQYPLLNKPRRQMRKALLRKVLVP